MSHCWEGEARETELLRDVDEMDDFIASVVNFEELLHIWEVHLRMIPLTFRTKTFNLWWKSGTEKQTAVLKTHNADGKGGCGAQAGVSVNPWDVNSTEEKPAAW